MKKILAIPFSDPTYNTYHDISDLPRTFLPKCATFQVYKNLEDKKKQS